MITVTLPYPVSANRYWSHRTVKPKSGPSFTTTFLTAEAKAYKADVKHLLYASGVHKAMEGRVRIDIVLYAKRPLDWQKRQRQYGAEWDNTVQRIDLDNARKCVYDSLKELAFQDDFWVWKDSGEVGEPDAHGARVVVRISSASLAQPQAGLDLVVPAVDPLEA
ncbi:RusA family crossover junction endodeoxyribonuclease [Paraburkholderia caribensis]|uniref:RusA family crossover junction endodeoxyribonuclease n=1 Tax=Paraburkholderia caribensis TaxID=75105 RepID=UPI0034D31BC9